MTLLGSVETDENDDPSGAIEGITLAQDEEFYVRILYPESNPEDVNTSNPENTDSEEPSEEDENTEENENTEAPILHHGHRSELLPCCYFEPTSYLSAFICTRSVRIYSNVDWLPSA